MINFIKSRFFAIKPEDDIISAYEEYEKEAMKLDIDNFSILHSIESSIITEIVTTYFVDPKQVTKENIRLKIKDKGFGLIKTTKIINDILSFMKEMSNKYTAEGV